MFKQGSPNLKGTKLQPLLAYRITGPETTAPTMSTISPPAQDQYMFQFLLRYIYYIYK